MIITNDVKKMIGNRLSALCSYRTNTSNKTSPKSNMIGETFPIILSTSMSCSMALNFS